MSEKVWETAVATRFYRSEFAHLIGRTILDARAMYDEEMEALDWDGAPGSVVILDDGGMFIPARDPEGNGPGWLMIQEGKQIGARNG